jgi:hypothetical protein
MIESIDGILETQENQSDRQIPSETIGSDNNHIGPDRHYVDPTGSDPLCISWEWLILTQC